MEIKITKYTWKGFNPCGLPARVVGETLADLEDKGVVLTPKNVLKSAAKKSSPIHTAFTWDDKAAANKYRESEASDMLRHIAIVYETGNEDEPTKETRAFVHVDESADTPRYVSIFRAMSDSSMKSDVLATALSELTSYRRKYAELETVAGFIEHFDKAIDSLRRVAVH